MSGLFRAMRRVLFTKRDTTARTVASRPLSESSPLASGSLVMRQADDDALAAKFKSALERARDDAPRTLATGSIIIHPKKAKPTS